MSHRFRWTSHYGYNRGSNPHTNDPKIHMTTCPICKGKGWYEVDDRLVPVCPKCKGYGEVRKSRNKQSQKKQPQPTITVRNIRHDKNGIRILD